MSEISWQPIDFWRARRRTDIGWIVVFGVVTAVAAVVIAYWGAPFPFMLFAAFASDLIFAGVLSLSGYLEYRVMPRAVGYDEGGIYFAWRRDSGRPDRVSFDELSKIEIRSIGVQLFLLGREAILVSPGPKYGSPFVNGLVQAWTRVLERTRGRLVTTHEHQVLEDVYSFHPATAG